MSGGDTENGRSTRGELEATAAVWADPDTPARDLRQCPELRSG
jgi:hypothetical protein